MIMRLTFRAFLPGVSIVLIMCGVCYASSASSSVKKGNRLYHEGQYEEALKYYNKAEADMPDSDVVNLNKGAALYQSGDYDKAIEDFTKSLLSDNAGIEEKAAYNIGNSKFRLGRLRVNTDLPSAINLYRQALDYYKRSIELNQDNADAKYNYEFVEKELEILLDKLKQQQQSGQDSQQKQQQGQEQSDATDQQQAQQEQKSRDSLPLAQDKQKEAVGGQEAQDTEEQQPAEADVSIVDKDTQNGSASVEEKSDTSEEESENKTE